MKTVKIVVLTFALLFCFNISALATQGSDYDRFIQSSGADGLYSDLTDDVKKALEELGINKVDFSSVFDVSFSKVFNVIKNVSSDSLEAPLKSLIKLICIIIVISIGESFVPDDGKYKSIVSILSTLFLISVIIVPLYQAIESAVSCVGVSCGFMKALIPVLTGVVSASGNPTLAISFQSIAFGVAQVIASVSKNYIVPLVGAVIALDITGAIMPAFKLSGITELVKKTVISVLSFTSTLYISFLSLKGALANAVDSVANKGIKLIISSAVPVVGSAVSEAYSGIIGSLVLAKSTIGIFSIAVIAVINAPAMLQLLFWIFALKAGSAVGEVFSQEGTVKLLKALAGAMTLLNVVLLFNAVLFIISLALILAIKGN